MPIHLVMQFSDFCILIPTQVPSTFKLFLWCFKYIWIGLKTISIDFLMILTLLVYKYSLPTRENNFEDKNFSKLFESLEKVSLLLFYISMVIKGLDPLLWHPNYHKFIEYKLFEGFSRSISLSKII